MPLTDSRFSHAKLLLSLDNPPPFLAISSAWGAICNALYSAAGRHKVNLFYRPNEVLLNLHKVLKSSLHHDVLTNYGRLRDIASAAHDESGGPITVDEAADYIVGAETLTKILDRV